MGLEKNILKENILESFLTVGRDFVWHKGLTFKPYIGTDHSRSIISYVLFLHSWWTLSVQNGGWIYFDLRGIGAGVPQGSVLCPVLCLLYTRDLPTQDQVTTVTCNANGIAYMTVGENSEIVVNSEGR